MLAVLLIISCSQPKQPKQPRQLNYDSVMDTLHIEDISIDYLKSHGWEISKRRLYYPQYQDSGYYYCAGSYRDSVLWLIHIHVIKGDTFISYFGNWYPEKIKTLNE